MTRKKIGDVPGPFLQVLEKLTVHLRDDGAGSWQVAFA